MRMWRSRLVNRLGRDLTRDIALVCLADGIVGVSFGAISVAVGLPLWLPMLLSVVVFAGASQFLFVAIIAAGGSPVAAFAAGFLVNARHLPFGLAIGEVVGSGWFRRIIGSQLIIDESTAFALAEREPARRRAAFWSCGIALFFCWNIGVVAGAFGGTVITDTDAFGMDAAFPAVLLALVMPSLNDRATRFAAIVGAVIAVAVTPVLPAGLPVLMSIIALPLVLIGSTKRRRGHPATPDSATTYDASLRVDSTETGEPGQAGTP
ncbi:MAG: AzlC family ABC transporter permease [Nakamurella sp.]